MCMHCCSESSSHPLIYIFCQLIASERFNERLNDVTAEPFYFHIANNSHILISACNLTTQHAHESAVTKSNGLEMESFLSLTF